MNYSVAEFRKNIRVALDAVDRGELVTITRHDKQYLIITSSNWNDSQTAAARTGVTHLISDEVSHNIRPDIQVQSTPKGKNGFYKLGQDRNKVNGHIPVEKNEPVATPPNEFAEALDASEQECCRKKAPCRHWQFQDGFWVNSLSGRSREVEQ